MKQNTKEKKEKLTPNRVIGILIAEEKYKFVNHALLAEIVNDTFDKICWRVSENWDETLGIFLVSRFINT